jgi:phospholipid/cholesterol/gamma-HCH transport system substrate-binding protein
MRLLSTEAKVGVVILAALVLLAALTFQVGKFHLGDRGYTIEATFRTVSGLEDKAKVRLAGVVVGTVERIFLREGRAHTTLRLDEGTVVREDSVIRVSSIGILSEYYIDITAGSLGARVLRPGEVVVGREMVEINELVAELADVAGNVKGLASRLGETFGGKGSTMARFLEDIDSLVGRVNGLVDENRRGVTEAITEIGGVARETRGLLTDNREELRGTIANLREFSATLTKRADELSTQVAKTAEELRGAVSGSREDVRALLASLRSAAGKADAAATSLESVLKKVDGGTGTIGRLVNDPGSVDRVDRALDQINDIAGKINSGEGTVGRLVTDDKLVESMEKAVGSLNKYLGESERMHLYLGYRGEYLERSTNVKSYVTVKLQPQHDKYYLLELVDDPAGRRTRTVTQTKVQRPDGSYDIKETTDTVDVNQLKLTAQFAKSFGMLTFRAGILESEGGVALDFNAPGDRLRLSADAWDFGRAEGPHVKFSGRYRFWKDVFVTAGVDDAVSGQLRSGFLGGGILFSDEDLKYVLSFGSLAK